MTTKTTALLAAQAPHQLVSFPQPKPIVRVAWFIWVAFALLNIGVLIASLPVTYAAYLQPCDGGPEAGCLIGQVSSAHLQTLVSDGANVGLLFGLMMVFIVGERLLELALSGLLIWHGHKDRAALMWAFLVLTCSTMIPDYQTALPADHLLRLLFIAGAWVNLAAINMAFVSLPDSRFSPRWTLFVALAFTAIFGLLQLFAPSMWHPDSPDAGLLNVLSLANNLFVLGTLLYRYVRVLTTPQRQQVKWIIYGVLVTVLVWITMDGIVPLVAPELNPAANPYFALFYRATTYVVIGFSFVCFTIAILRHQLFDIDVIISRTLVYSMLTLLVIGLYIGIVSALGRLFHSEDSLASSLAATGIIALLFQPLQRRLQRLIERLLYGKRDEPVAVLTNLGKQIETTTTPEGVLFGLVETLARDLRLPYVALEVNTATGSLRQTAIGTTETQPERFPLQHQGREIGWLMAAARGRGDTLNRQDRLLLENAARLASSAVHAAELAVELQESRQRIVSAREEERRRLRRDLHDGLGPALAALALQAQAARELLPSEPERSDQLLEELTTGTQEAIADIRRVVYALRPPALDDLGLLSALEEQFAQYREASLQFSVDLPAQLPPLPAAVEVAVFRITQEALTNIIRHAGATCCQLRLSVSHELRLDIVDDGRGIPPDYRAGVGLNSMRERATELGGQCLIESTLSSGTHVSVRLPLVF
jgi:signal transduction histidine kinase